MECELLFLLKTVNVYIDMNAIRKVYLLFSAFDRQQTMQKIYKQTMFSNILESKGFCFHDLVRCK